MIHMLYVWFMGISSKHAKIFNSFTPEAKKRLIKMAWSDKVSFKEIEKDFNLVPSLVEKFMRYSLSPNEFKRWMIRQQKRFTQKSKKAAKLRLND